MIILSLLAVGFYMAGIDNDAPDKYDLYPLHKSFGMIALVLALIRLPVRIKTDIPAPLEGLKAWENKLSHAVHILLYVAMISMTWSGYLMSSTFIYGEGIEIFGLFTVGDLTPKSEVWSGIFHTAHGYLAWSFVVLLTLHIAGVFKHRLFDEKENDVLPRML